MSFFGHILVIQIVMSLLVSMEWMAPSAAAGCTPLLRECYSDDQCCTGLCAGRIGKDKKCRFCARKKETCEDDSECCQSPSGRMCHPDKKICVKCPGEGCPSPGESGSECQVDADCGDNRFTCIMEKCVRLGDPQFSLTWFGDDDLDLHVILPNGFEIYFGAKEDPDTGCRLDMDMIPAVEQDNVENVFCPESAPSGNYTYFVRNFAEQGSGQDPWTLKVFQDGQYVEMNNGSTENQQDSTLFHFSKS